MIKMTRQNLCGVSWANTAACMFWCRVPPQRHAPEHGLCCYRGPRHHYKILKMKKTLRISQASPRMGQIQYRIWRIPKWIQSVTLWMHLAQRERSALQPCCFATCASLQRLSASRLATSSTVQQPFKSSKPSMHDLRLSIGKSWMWFIQLLDLQVLQFEFL